MTTSSRATIRQEVAKYLPNVLVGTSDSSSSTTELVDADEEFVSYESNGGNDLEGYWIVRPSASAAGDRLRRVAKHDKHGGILKPSRSWTNSPGTEIYELWPPDIRPTLVDNAINTALARLSYIVEESLTIVDNTNTYSLASYTWLLNERQVTEVYQVYTSSGNVLRTEWQWFKVFPDSGVLTLQLWPPPRTITGLSCIIEGIARYTTLSTDAATTTCPLEWVAAAALVETLRALRSSTLGQDTTRWKEEFVQARNKFLRLSRRYTPRRGRRIMPRTPTLGPSQGPKRRGVIFY